MNEIKELKYGNTRCYCINNKVLIDTDWAGTLSAFFKSAKENNIDMVISRKNIYSNKF